ncbi:MAG: hypothetical protein HY343_00750 [Lentisphaerae bacterium]|nr:hypothetical protein [Lentisphaerota bacterium]
MSDIQPLHDGTQDAIGQRWLQQYQEQLNRQIQTDIPPPIPASSKSETKSKTGENYPWSSEKNQALVDQFLAGKTVFPTYSKRQILQAPTSRKKPSSDSTEEEAIQRELIRQLQQRDNEVRLHEMIHKSILGPYGGAVQYEYETGPDGKVYAVGGSIDVDLSEAATPEATQAKALTVRAASLAVGNPSPADIATASKASLIVADTVADMPRKIIAVQA